MIRPAILISLALALLLFLVSCSGHTAGQAGANRLVELLPIELDSRNPQKKEFGRLEFLNGFQLRSRDPRFGGLSGLTIGADGKLYAVSDAGYWVSAQMILDSDTRLLDLTDWVIQPLLSTTGTPVTDPLHDAEALARAPDGSFMVAFENVHRIWRYPPTACGFLFFTLSGCHPRQKYRRRRAMVDWKGSPFFRMGAWLVLTEEFQNRDGSFKVADSRASDFSSFPTAFRGVSSNGLRSVEQRRCDRSRAPLRSVGHPVGSA